MWYKLKSNLIPNGKKPKLNLRAHQSDNKTHTKMPIGRGEINTA